VRAHLAWWSALVLGLVFQTAVLPFVVADPWRPDFTRLLVLWVALTGLPRGGAVVALSAGLALDAASGTPLGFGMLLRLAVYGAARPLRGVFFDDRPFLLLPLAALAALVEAGAVGALSAFAFRGAIPLGALAATSLPQALLDAFLVPPVFVALELATGRRQKAEVPA
jgi:rod shape-determining protein MreD